jgi:hypothetical protein
LNDVTGNNEQQTCDNNKKKCHFLFSLRSPEPTLSGEVLVPETPESEMYERGRGMIERRLKKLGLSWT